MIREESERRDQRRPSAPTVTRKETICPPDTLQARPLKWPGWIQGIRESSRPPRQVLFAMTERCSLAHALESGQLLEHSRWMRALARPLVLDGESVDDFVQNAWAAALRRPPHEDVPLNAGWPGC